MAEDKVPCDFCRTGMVALEMEEMVFHQSSDKGTVRCQVHVLVGTCDTCGSKSLGKNSADIFDAAFKRAYDKLP
jgi:hypothetical protein